MRISPINYSTMLNRNIVPGLPSFGAKNPNTRKADDVMRASKLEFPAFSPNYAALTYAVTRPQYKNSKQVLRKFKDLDSTVMNKIRDNSKNVTQPKALLDNVRQEKLAYCYEQTVALMAYMYSKGYEDIKAVGLCFDGEIINKKDGKVKANFTEDFAHNFLLAGMKNPDRYDLDELIVIDPWLGFAGSISEAKARYIATFEPLLHKMELIKAQELQEAGLDYKDYNIAGKLDFYPLDFSEDEIEEIKNYLPC